MDNPRLEKNNCGKNRTKKHRGQDKIKKKICIISIVLKNIIDKIIKFKQTEFLLLNGLQSILLLIDSIP